MQSDRYQCAVNHLTCSALLAPCLRLVSLLPSVKMKHVSHYTYCHYWMCSSSAAAPVAVDTQAAATATTGGTVPAGSTPTDTGSGSTGSSSGSPSPPGSPSQSQSSSGQSSTGAAAVTSQSSAGSPAAPVAQAPPPPATTVELSVFDGYLSNCQVWTFTSHRATLVLLFMISIFQQLSVIVYDLPFPATNNSAWIPDARLLPWVNV